MITRKEERQEGARAKMPPSTCPPRDLLPPGKSHLLQFPAPPKTMPPAGDQDLNTLSCGESFIIQTVTLVIFIFSYFSLPC
jgi:hypothetical protein